MKFQTSAISVVGRSLIRTIDIRPDFYNAKTKSFCFECSDVDICYPGHIVCLRNPKTNGSSDFFLTKIDRNEDDICGWNYSTKNGTYSLLNIND